MSVEKKTNVVELPASRLGWRDHALRLHRSLVEHSEGCSFCSVGYDEKTGERDAMVSTACFDAALLYDEWMAAVRNAAFVIQRQTGEVDGALIFRAAMEQSKKER
jgi:hypothetical protein